MVLEYLEGEDLQRVLRRTGPLDPDLALRIVAQACVGLQRAHEASVVHRDIKPANLYLAKRAGKPDELVVKILDFGVAKIMTDPGEDGVHGDGLTRTGSLLGSPMYMSPEQARSVKKVDGRADLRGTGRQCLRHFGIGSRYCTTRDWSAPPSEANAGRAASPP
jgi:serine/threonine-protein kinase